MDFLLETLCCNFKIIRSKLAILEFTFTQYILCKFYLVESSHLARIRTKKKKTNKTKPLNYVSDGLHTSSHIYYTFVSIESRVFHLRIFSMYLTLELEYNHHRPTMCEIFNLTFFFFKYRIRLLLHHLLFTNFIYIFCFFDERKRNWKYFWLRYVGTVTRYVPYNGQKTTNKIMTMAVSSRCFFIILVASTQMASAD